MEFAMCNKVAQILNRKGEGRWWISLRTYGIVVIGYSMYLEDKSPTPTRRRHCNLRKIGKRRLKVQYATKSCIFGIRDKKGDKSPKMHYYCSLFYMFGD
jgi:hypothetical protein